LPTTTARGIGGRGDGRVCVTQAILKLLNEDELRAVLGHEISHLKNLIYTYMIDVKNKSIVILGAARSGLAAAKLLKQKGARLFVSDYAPAKQKETEIKKPKPTRGLLTPTNGMPITVDEDLSQPVTRVKKHLQAIRERRENINGS